MNIIEVGDGLDLSIAKIHRREQVIPIKYCYPGIGGDRWVETREEEEAFLQGRTTRATKASFAASEPLPQLLHIGVGDGIELPWIQERFPTSSYVGVDISLQMIKNAFREHNATLERFPSYTFILSDVEEPGSLARIRALIQDSPTLYLIPNQGVLNSNMIFLEELAESMRPDDRAAMTFERFHGSRPHILGKYDLPKVHDLIAVGLKRAGIEKPRLQPAIYNPETENVEMWHDDGNERILCLTSYKPLSKASLREKLDSAGLVAASLTLDQHSGHYVCTARRH